MNKTLGAAVLVLAGIGFLSGCAFGNATLEQKNISSSLEQRQSGEVSTKIEYTNAQYDLTLKFPQTWKGFTVNNRTLDWGEFGKSDSLDFGFGEKNSIFNIAIHPKEQWKKIALEQEAESRYIQVPLAENKDFVFSFASTGDVANDEMYARLSEVQDIIKTFEVKPFDVK